MRKLLFQSTDELTAFLAVPATFNFDGIAPHIWTLQDKFLKPLLSKSLLDKLVDYCQGDDDIPEEYNEALNLSRYVLAQIILRDTTDLLNISITQGGFTVNSSEDRVTASANRVLLLKEQLTVNSQIGIDQLYQYLEDNAADLTEYENSDERKSLKRNFIPDAKTFSSGLVAIEIGHFVFSKMRDVMSVIEKRYLIKALGADLFAEIQSKVKNSEDLGDYAPILPFIQKAIPALVFYECAQNMGITVEERGVFISYIKNANEPQQKGAVGENSIDRIAARHKQYGMERMEDLTKHLMDNKDTYPLFTSSTAYTDRSTDRIEPGKEGVFYGLN